MALRRSGALARRLIQHHAQLAAAERPLAEQSLQCLPGWSFSRRAAECNPGTVWEQHTHRNGLWQALHSFSAPLQQSAQPAVAEDTSRSEHQHQPPEQPSSGAAQHHATSSEGKVHCTLFLLAAGNKRPPRSPAAVCFDKVHFAPAVVGCSRSIASCK